MTPEEDRQRFERAGVMRLADFEQLKRGQIVRLHYNDHNKGAFNWVHDHVEGEDVYGRFVYDNDSLDDALAVGPYLYMFRGYVCSGSGAEPACREMPIDDPDDEGGGVWSEDMEQHANPAESARS